MTGNSLKELVANAKESAEDPSKKLIVVGPHTRYLEMTEAERPSTPEARQFVVDALAGKFKHPRAGRFSPSSIAGCKRRLLFGFAGAPEVGENIDAQDLMGLGSWGHLRWQHEGLSMGYMLDAEVWTFDRRRRIGGSIDGMLYDDSVFELKTVFGPKFSRITQQNRTPEYEHRLQFQAYVESEGVELGSVVYEDRGTGRYFEYRIAPDEKLSKDLEVKLDELNNRAEEDDLPPMLEDCSRGVGYVFNQCPFRKHCPKATSLGIEVAPVG